MRFPFPYHRHPHFEGQVFWIGLFAAYAIFTTCVFLASPSQGADRELRESSRNLFAPICSSAQFTHNPFTGTPPDNVTAVVGFAGTVVLEHSDTHQVKVFDTHDLWEDNNGDDTLTFKRKVDGWPEKTFMIHVQANKSNALTDGGVFTTIEFVSGGGGIIDVILQYQLANRVRSVNFAEHRVILEPGEGFTVNTGGFVTTNHTLVGYSVSIREVKCHDVHL